MTAEADCGGSGADGVGMTGTKRTSRQGGKTGGSQHRFADRLLRINGQPFPQAHLLHLRFGGFVACSARNQRDRSTSAPIQTPDYQSVVREVERQSQADDVASSDRSREVLPVFSDDTRRSFGTTPCALHNHPKRITGELIKQMKLSKLALVAAIACGTYAGNVFADQTNDISIWFPAAPQRCDCGEPVCGCEPAAVATPTAATAVATPAVAIPAVASEPRHGQLPGGLSTVATAAWATRTPCSVSTADIRQVVGFKWATHSAALPAFNTVARQLAAATSLVVRRKGDRHELRFRYRWSS